MQKNNNEVDIILKVLSISVEAFPASVFVNSLMQQYRERGSLSKKQLEGLHSKASKINGIAPGILATLQAIILKKQTRHKSTVSPELLKPVEVENNYLQLVNEILEKYPQHKRVLFFKIKLDTGAALLPAEQDELKKFHRLIL